MRISTLKVNLLNFFKSRAMQEKFFFFQSTIALGAFFGFFGSMLLWIFWPIAPFFGWIFMEALMGTGWRFDGKRPASLLGFAVGLFLAGLPMWLINTTSSISEQTTWLSVLIQASTTTILFLFGVSMHLLYHWIKSWKSKITTIA